MQDILSYAIPNSGCLFWNDSHHPLLTLVSVPYFCVAIASIRAMTCLWVRRSQWRHILLEINHLSFFLTELHLTMLMHEPHTSGTRAVSICYIAVNFGHEITCNIRKIILWHHTDTTANLVHAKSTNAMHLHIWMHYMHASWASAPADG